MSENLTAQPQATTQPQAEETPVSTGTEQQTVPQTIKVKYNKQEQELPYDEAVTYVQKGMNYDKVYEELQTLKNDEVLKWIDDVASEYGVTRNELKEKWATEISDAKANDYAEKNKVSPEFAKELLAVQRERDRYAKQVQATQQQKSQQELIDNQIKEFHESFPDVKDEDVPDAVLEECKKGTPLKIAYKAYIADMRAERISALEKELQIKSVNDKNASSSMGSAASAGDTVPTEITEQSLKEMTSAQRRKRMPEIIEWLKNRKQ